MDGTVIVIMLISGGICAAIASSKGRSGIGWFFIGAFFGLLGIIVALVVSNEGEADRQRQHARTERRRLRQQLNQERMKSETFRRHAADRIDAHDRLLGTDTRRDAQMVGGGDEPRSRLQSGAPPPPQELPSHAWYYLLGDQEEGPVGASVLKQHLASGQLAWETLVWREGLKDWVAASRVRSLRS